MPLRRLSPRAAPAAASRRARSACSARLHRAAPATCSHRAHLHRAAPPLPRAACSFPPQRPTTAPFALWKARTPAPHTRLPAAVHASRQRFPHHGAPREPGSKCPEHLSSRWPLTARRRPVLLTSDAHPRLGPRSHGLCSLSSKPLGIH